MSDPVRYNPVYLVDIAAGCVASLVTQENQLVCMEIPPTLYPILVVKLHRHQEERKRQEMEKLKKVTEKKLERLLRREKMIFILLLIAAIVGTIRTLVYKTTVYLIVSIVIVRFLLLILIYISINIRYIRYI